MILLLSCTRVILENNGNDQEGLKIYPLVSCLILSNKHPLSKDMVFFYHRNYKNYPLPKSLDERKINDILKCYIQCFLNNLEFFPHPIFELFFDNQ